MNIDPCAWQSEEEEEVEDEAGPSTRRVPAKRLKSAVVGSAVRGSKKSAAKLQGLALME